MKTFFKRRKNKKSDCWKLTDNVISILDEIHNIKPEFSSKFGIKDKTYTCFRNMQGINIYVLEGTLDKLKSISLVYDKDSNLINISQLEQYIILKKVYSVVSNKVVPPGVNIKIIYCCNITDINIFIEKVIILEQYEELFKDLLNFESLKDKYELDKEK